MFVAKTLGKMVKGKTLLQKIGYQPPHPGPDGGLRDRGQIRQLHASSATSGDFQVRGESTRHASRGRARYPAAVPVDALPKSHGGGGAALRSV